MIEYSPWPGTLRSKPREVTDEPWTKNNTGRDGSPGFGSPTRLRNIHKGISPFFAQYFRLQISPPFDGAASDGSVVALCAGRTSARPAAARPSPVLLIKARRASGRSKRVISSSILYYFC